MYHRNCHAFCFMRMQKLCSLCSSDTDDLCVLLGLVIQLFLEDPPLGSLQHKVRFTPHSKLGQIVNSHSKSGQIEVESPIEFLNTVRCGDHLGGAKGDQSIRRGARHTKPAD